MEEKGQECWGQGPDRVSAHLLAFLQSQLGPLPVSPLHPAFLDQICWSSGWLVACLGTVIPAIATLGRFCPILAFSGVDILDYYTWGNMVLGSWELRSSCNTTNCNFFFFCKQIQRGIWSKMLIVPRLRNPGLFYLTLVLPPSQKKTL